jgi:hypothetical protein
MDIHLLEIFQLAMFEETRGYPQPPCGCLSHLFFQRWWTFAVDRGILSGSIATASTCLRFGVEWKRKQRPPDILGVWKLQTDKPIFIGRPSYIYMFIYNCGIILDDYGWFKARTSSDILDHLKGMWLIRRGCAGPLELIPRGSTRNVIPPVPLYNSTAIYIYIWNIHKYTTYVWYIVWEK